MQNGQKKLNIKPTDTAMQLQKHEKLLLHCCCAPCATAVIERILPNISAVTLYYYNPNTYPKTEYDKRLHELEKLAKIYNLQLIAENYDENEFFSAVIGHEDESEGGSRCNLCIALRLKRAQEYACRHGYDAFTTTLSVSPHKNAEFINTYGRTLSSDDCEYIDADFKKANGFLRSTQLTEQYGLYRQNYCGCKFSQRGNGNDD